MYIHVKTIEDLSKKKSKKKGLNIGLNILPFWGGECSSKKPYSSGF
ncbi:hypothetical protein PORCRE_1268 [Porphyromonas crevioricanis JCM 15906]|uniref:Uncharacterized protein n=1 Tax=Porphyromonas crevioricanis JCM 15906 TaxID=1305617 RepID=T1CR55_9PORP|nr:hypothetical protein PORCRE_1268 [Porphyromonas crevioricanis JCM 15906]